MNSLEKKSFYSFLGLYIISSTLFILLSAYWYYTAQKSALQSNDYYKLQHRADILSQEIIASHMQGRELPSMPSDKMSTVSLVDTSDRLVSGELMGDFMIEKDGYFSSERFSSLVSSAPQEHQNIQYVVIQSSLLPLELRDLKRRVVVVVALVLVLMMVLAWALSKLFMRPLHQKIQQIEDFVQDTAHELNTPITALSMSVSRAMKKEEYDAKTLKNISISTKQLFNIYTALAYLSFESKEKGTHFLDVKEVLEKSVAYYQELSESKRIEIRLQAESFEYKMDAPKLEMLFGNLINNAIKYSHPSSLIDISLKNGIFSIRDHGIGIREDKLQAIYEKYNRETEYAGGFGIGLSTVQKIAHEHGLGLEVDSQLGKGSCFRVIFQ